MSLHPVGPPSEADIIQDKQERTRAILRAAQDVRALPKCETCRWANASLCEQPLVSQLTVDPMGRDHRRSVSQTDARRDPALCGPAVHLWQPTDMSVVRRRARLAAWKKYRGELAKALLAVALGCLIGGMLWLFGFWNCLMGVGLIVVLLMFGA